MTSSSPTWCSSSPPGRGTIPRPGSSTGTTTSSTAEVVADPRIPAVVVARDAPRRQLPRPVVRRPPAPRVRPPAASTELGDDAWWDLLLRADLDGRAGRADPAGARAPPPPARRHQAERRRSPSSRRTSSASGRTAPRGARPGGLRVRLGPRRVAARHRDHPDPPQPSRCCRPCLPQPGRAPTTRRFDVIVVDNGGRTDEPRPWYAATVPPASISRSSGGTTPSTTRAVNNVAAAADARGDVLRVPQRRHRLPRPGLAARAASAGRSQPDIGVVGLQLIDARRARSSTAASILGLNGFADHLFEGMRRRRAVADRSDDLVPQRPGGHRGVPRDPAPALRRARRIRRAVRALR